MQNMDGEIMNDKEISKADTLRKAQGMSATDRIDFLLADIRDEYKEDNELRMQDFTKRAIYLVIGVCGLVLFLVISHYFGLFTIS